jgi:hypothetical protein
MELFIVGGRDGPLRAAAPEHSLRESCLAKRSVCILRQRGACLRRARVGESLGRLMFAWVGGCARWTSRRGGVMRGDQERRKWKEKTGTDPASCIAGNATRRFVEGYKRESEGETGGGAGVERIWDGGWWKWKWKWKCGASNPKIRQRGRRGEWGGSRCRTQEIMPRYA